MRNRFALNPINGEAVHSCSSALVDNSGSPAKCLKDSYPG